MDKDPYCKKCADSCKTCSDLGESNCIECKDGLIKTERNYCLEDSEEYKIFVVEKKYIPSTFTLKVTFNKAVTTLKGEIGIKNVFKYILVDENDINIVFSHETIKLSGKEMTMKMKIKQTIVNGKFIFKKIPYNENIPNSGVLVLSENRKVNFSEDIIIDNINLSLNALTEQLDNIGTVGAPVLKSMTGVTMVVSIGSAIALIKIFQMMDYMILFSVVHPVNFSRFVDIFSTNILNDLPNIFTFFVDNECERIRPKFNENEMSCQFFSNCGSLMFIILFLLIIKFFLVVIKWSVTTKNDGRLMSRTTIIAHKLCDSLDYEFCIDIMDMLQLDFYLAIYL